jgi:hypothetical protein
MGYVREELSKAEPVIEKIYNHLKDNRDCSIQLVGCLADVLAMWCIYAIASDSAFAVIEVIADYDLERYDGTKKACAKDYHLI